VLSFVESAFLIRILLQVTN